MLKLPKRYRIHNIFYVFLLNQNITRKREVDAKISLLEFEENDKSKKYEVKAIYNNIIYAKKS